ncbi:MAG: hypothetical protein GX163_11720 [Bacteroidetes bacterium]|jgi:hypothetical protein|nr:hypothetical protein [Bacteroidota bacterium]
MKKLIYTLMAIIVGIIVVNVFKLDSGDVFEGDSSIAVVSILAAACAFVLLWILLVSKEIAAKIKNKN